MYMFCFFSSKLGWTDIWGGDGGHYCRVYKETYDRESFIFYLLTPSGMDFKIGSSC